MVERSGKIGAFSLLVGLWVSSVTCPVWAEDISALIVLADAAYTKREDLNQANLALDTYKHVLQVDSNSSDAYWKASRTAWWIGDQSGKRNDRLNYFQQGIHFAKQAI